MPSGRDDVIHAGHQQPEHVEVALHQDDRLLLADRPLRLVHVVQLLPLVEDRGLGRIEILGLARAEQPAAESGDPSPKVVNREEEAGAEPWDHGSVVLLHREPRGEQHLVPDAELLHGGEERLRDGGKAEAVDGGGLQGKIASLEVLARGFRLRQLEQLPGEPVMRGGDRAVERLERIGARAGRPLGNHDAAPPCDLPDRGGVVHPGPLHQPGEHVAGGMTDEAVIAALLRNDGEVSVGAAMEGTGAAVVRAGAPQIHRFADDPHDVRAVPDLLDHVVGDQAHAENSTMVTPVPP